MDFHFHLDIPPINIACVLMYPGPCVLTTMQVAQASINFEAQRTYLIGVKCFDLNVAPQYFTKTFFNITVVDVNEAPISLNISADKATENQQPGEEVGRFSAMDPDNEAIIHQARQSHVLVGHVHTYHIFLSISL